MDIKYDMITFSIADQCNLRCPSCPAEHISRTGKLRYAPLDLCDTVLSKISRDYGSPRVALYCLSEPLLHPDIDKIFDMATSYGLKLNISTNLNTQRDLAPIVEHPALGRFDISVSGFTPDVYQRGHRNGRLELVKKNMSAIAKMRHQDNIFVKFLLYNDNAEDAIAMERYTKELGFNFCSIPAVYFPYGEVLEANIIKHTDFTPPAEVEPLLDRLLVKNAWQLRPSKNFEASSCYNQNNILFINYAGQVFTCNYVTYKEFGVVGDFTKLSATEIHEKKINHTFCKKCHAFGVQAQSAVESTFKTDQELIAFHNFLSSQKPNSIVTKQIYIYGASLLGHQIFSLLRGRSVPVVGFIDDNVNIKADSTGVPVYQPANIPVHDTQDMIIISSIFSSESLTEELNNKLTSLGLPKMQTFGAFLSCNY